MKLRYLAILPLIACELTGNCGNKESYFNVGVEIEATDEVKIFSRNITKDFELNVQKDCSNNFCLSQIVEKSPKISSDDLIETIITFQDSSTFKDTTLIKENTTHTLLISFENTSGDFDSIGKGYFKKKEEVTIPCE